MTSLPLETARERGVLRHRDFRFFLSARFLALVSHQMINVAMGQYIWELTHRPLYLGYIGLALFAPKFIFSIVSGHTADRYDRRLVILTSRAVQLLAALGLVAILLLSSSSHLWMLFTLLFLIGVANAFDGPASSSIVPQLVPLHHLKDAVTWSTSSVQFSFIAGPAAAGWIYALSNKAVDVLYVVAIMRLLSIVFVAAIRSRTEQLDKSEISWKTLMAGLGFVFQKRVILGAISLDLFAVLLGGAVGLMPIYANEILKVGPSGLGILRAAPAIGAGFTALALTYLPPLKKAGATMFACVALFGIATILFGISKSFYFSLFCLFVLGAADMVSVVIRGVLVQIKTPPGMRGRVSAVNLVFIGASNELGEFESGLTAAWFGVVPAVVLGGAGTLAVVGLWSWLFPELRRYDRLEDGS